MLLTAVAGVWVFGSSDLLEVDGFGGAGVLRVFQVEGALDVGAFEQQFVETGVAHVNFEPAHEFIFIRNEKKSWMNVESAHDFHAQ